jgi:hypothetical protein
MRSITLAIILCFSTLLCQGQSKAVLEAEIMLDSLHALMVAGDWMSEGYEDESKNIPFQFHQLLVKTLQHRSSFNYSFPKLNSSELSIGTSFSILTSPDGRVRFFVWNTYDGGMSNPNIDWLVQYKTETNQVNVADIDREERPEDDEDADMEYHSLDVVKGLGRNSYITTGMEKSCGTCWYFSVEAFEIVDGKFQRLALFKYKGKEKAIVTTTKFSRPIFDPKKQELTFEEIEAEDFISGPVTSRTLIKMKLSGNHFRVTERKLIPDQD